MVPGLSPAPCDSRQRAGHRGVRVARKPSPRVAGQVVGDSSCRRRCMRDRLVPAGYDGRRLRLHIATIAANPEKAAKRGGHAGMAGARNSAKRAKKMASAAPGFGLTPLPVELERLGTGSFNLPVGHPPIKCEFHRADRMIMPAHAAASKATIGRGAVSSTVQADFSGEIPGKNCAVPSHGNPVASRPTPSGRPPAGSNTWPFRSDRCPPLLFQQLRPRSALFTAAGEAAARPRRSARLCSPRVPSRAVASGLPHADGRDLGDVEAGRP